MLFDPKWEVQAKPDVLSLDNLIAWMERQPADAIYCYDDAGHCLLAQYFTSAGHDMGSLGNVYVRLDGKLRDIPVSFQRTAMPHPHTFGAALTRARKALTA